MNNALTRRTAKLKRSLQKVLFNAFLNRHTKLKRAEILKAAQTALTKKMVYESDEMYLNSTQATVRQGYQLRKDALAAFFNIHKDKTAERILIQIPDADFSPAGYSLFTNLLESFQFLGVPCQKLGWSDDSRMVIETFMPTVLLSSDHSSYLERISWDDVREYKNKHSLKIGLTASLAEYDNSPLPERLQWAKEHAIDFFYSFRDEEYFRKRKQYQPFYEAGYSILSIPFGANILHYYPVPGFERDLSFALMASRKREHILYLQEISKKYAGFIDGPNWNHVKDFDFNRDRDRYIYARAKVGLNVHLPEQIEWACELNERTYQLAACGTPQLIDQPLLLNKIFSQDMIFSASSPREYMQLFKYILANPSIAQEKALLAQREVFSKHTTFHRAQSFLNQLEGLAK